MLFRSTSALWRGAIELVLTFVFVCVCVLVSVCVGTFVFIFVVFIFVFLFVFFECGDEGVYIFWLVFFVCGGAVFIFVAGPIVIVFIRLLWVSLLRIGGGRWQGELAF